MKDLAAGGETGEEIYLFAFYTSWSGFKLMTKIYIIGAPEYKTQVLLDYTDQE